MTNNILVENSMYKDAAGRAAIVADPELANDLFFVNFLGFIGLYALNDSRGYMKTHEASEKKLKISEIADDNHDSSLAVKLCVDAGILSEAKTVGVTKLLSLIKSRTIRATDIDDAKIRDLVLLTGLSTKPMSGPVDAVVTAYMAAKFDVKEYSRQIYECMKRAELRDYTLEIRNIIIKGQYTDYFTVMKRQAAAGITPAAAKPIASSIKSTAPGSAPAQAAVAPKVDVDKAKAEAAAKAAELSAANVLKAGQILTDIYTKQRGDLSKIIFMLKERVSDLSTTWVDLELAAASPTAFPDSVFTRDAPLKDSTLGSSLALKFREAITKRALASVMHTGFWANTQFFSSISFPFTPAFEELIKESYQEAMKSWGDPFAKNIEDWRWLVAGFIRTTPTYAERRKFADTYAKNDSEDGHQVWLNVVRESLGGNVLVGGPLSKKAKAWIDKFGKLMEPKLVVDKGVMTRDIWTAMRSLDQALWIAKNFNQDGAKKLKAITSMNYELRLSLDDDAASVAAALGDIWLDENAMSTLCLPRTSPHPSHVATSFATVAAVAGMYRITSNDTIYPVVDSWKKTIGISPRIGRISSIRKVTAEMSKMPLTTAGEVEAFVKRASQIWGDQLTTESDGFPIDASEEDVQRSGVAWLFFVRSGRAVRGMISVTDSVSIKQVTTLNDDSWHPKIMEWVTKFGASGPRLLQAAIVVKNLEEYVDIIVRGTFYATIPESSMTAPVAIKAEAANLGSIGWRAAMEKILDPALFSGEIKTSVDSFSDNLWTSYIDGFSKACSVWAVNNLSYNVLSKIRGLEGDAWASVEAPMTPDKIQYVLENTRESYYSTAMPLDLAQDMVASMTQYDWMNPDNASAIRRIISRIAAASPSIMADAFRAAMIAGKSWVAPFAIEPTYGTLGGAGNYDLHRWAWGLSVDQIKTIIPLRGVTAHAGNISFSVKNNAAIGVDQGITDDIRRAISDAYGSNTGYIVLSAWGDTFADEIVGSFTAELGGAARLERYFDENEGNDVAIRIAQRIFDERFAPSVMANPGDGNGDEHLVSIAVGLFNKYGGSTRTGMDLMKAYIDKKPPTWPIVDIAAFLAKAKEAGVVGSIDKGSMVLIVNKLAKSTSKVALEAIPDLAFSDTSSSVINPAFVEAVRAARVEKAVVNRLRGMNIMQQAVDIINQDPNAASIKVDGARVDTFLKFNDVDLSLIATDTIKTLEDLSTSRNLVAVAIPKLMMEDISTPELLKARTKDLHKNNRYNHSPALGIDVKRAFAVKLNGQQERFDAWVAAHPTTKILTLYHGTGTINAAFILRFGFKIIKSTDASVTGRMLGDGIYFADNINKSMLYMSNAGYVRSADQEGYVFRCRVALGRSPNDHREGNASRSGLVSNEWSIFDLDQIVIEEAYYGFSRAKQTIRDLVSEAGETTEKFVSTFMFMDGRVPVSKDMLVDFEEMITRGDHVWIETSAKGPIVCIRHDQTVQPIHRCYRYGEELQSSVNAKELKVFLKLLSNRY
jgi:hypothetical protein